MPRSMPYLQTATHAAQVHRHKEGRQAHFGLKPIPCARWCDDATLVTCCHRALGSVASCAG